MKKAHIILLLSFMLNTACGEYDINGNLDGMWHLRTVETYTDNYKKDVKEERIYYSIQQHLIRLKKHNLEEQSAFIGRFIHQKDSLILHNLVIFQNEGIAATPKELDMFYLDGSTSRYTIKKLNANEMILRSKYRELILKKF